MRFMRFVRLVRSVGFNVLAECSNVQRIFVRRVGFRFGDGLR